MLLWLWGLGLKKLKAFLQRILFENLRPFCRIFSKNIFVVQIIYTHTQKIYNTHPVPYPISFLAIILNYLWNLK